MPEAGETLEDLQEVWCASVESRADLGAHSRRNYITAARHLTGTIGRVRLPALDRSVLEGHRDFRMGDERAAAATVRKEIKVMRVAWRWGQEHTPPLCPDRSLPSVKLEGEGVRNRYTPSPGEVAEVLKHLRS